MITPLLVQWISTTSLIALLGALICIAVLSQSRLGKRNLLIVLLERKWITFTVLILAILSMPFALSIVKGEELSPLILGTFVREFGISVAIFGILCISWLVSKTTWSTAKDVFDFIARITTWHMPHTRTARINMQQQWLIDESHQVETLNKLLKGDMAVSGLLLSAAHENALPQSMVEGAIEVQRDLQDMHCKGDSTNSTTEYILDVTISLADPDARDAPGMSVGQEMLLSFQPESVREDVECLIGALEYSEL